jgi:hypothetical protein
VALVIGAASLAACSNERDEGASSVHRATTTTSTTTLAERYAVPATITIEYVNDVLAALNTVFGGVVRAYIETRTLKPDDLVPLRAIYYEGEFRDQTAALTRSPLKPRDHYRPMIGDRRVTVDRVLTASSQCIAVEATYDFSALSEQPAPASKGWVTLKPKQPDTDPTRRNPTPWQIASESNDPENGCA